MRQMHRVFLALLVIVSGCAGEPTRVEVSALVGEWESRREPLQPSGSLQRRFSFAADGRFAVHSIVQGVYAGQSANDLSAVSTTRGRFRVESDRLHLQPDSLVSWDAFSGTAEHTVTKPYPYHNFYDDATFTVRGDELTLTYLTYPADTPVVTRRTLWRVGPD